MEINPYVQIVKSVHRKLSPIIAIILMLKSDIIQSVFFYSLMELIKFNGLFILTSNFDFSKHDRENKVEITNIFRTITFHRICEIFNLKLTHYFIICTMIILKKVIYTFLLIRLYVRIKYKINVETITLSKAIKSIFYFELLCSPIFIEFLFFIYYIILFPNSFVIKKDYPNSICIVFAFLNTCAIFFTIYCSFIYDQVINLIFPFDDHPFRDKFERNRCIILIISQNLIIIESLELYLDDKYLKVYKIIVMSFIMMLLIILFFSSITRYNFDTPINSLIQFFLTFCFANSIIEIILYVSKFKIVIIRECIFLNLCKVIICCLLMYIYNFINERNLLKKCKVELFKINDVKIVDLTVYDTFYFIFEKLKLIQKKNGDITSQNILNVFFEHQSECKNEHCKCKIIRIIPSGQNFQNNFLSNLIERMGFLIETSFVQIDYTLDYDLSLLLAEYYYTFKKNYIKSYSILQTYLHFNVDQLSIVKTIRIYCLSQKYIKSFYIQNYENIESNAIFIDIFFNFEKMKKIEKLITKYAGNYIQILNYKEIFESSIKVNRDTDTGEIKNIENTFLSSVNIENIIKLIKLQINLYKTITSNIYFFEHKKIILESYYKLFIFFELFNEGKIPKKMVSILYQFSKNKNIYSIHINDLTFQKLLEQIQKKYNDISQGYNIIFSFSKGLIIKYFSEHLSVKLGFTHANLIGSDISVLFPKELREAHQNNIIKQVISEQKTYFKKRTSIFTVNDQSFPIIITSSSIPGIYKNLIVISNIVFRYEQNKYSFILNQNGTVISISNNFDTYYALGMKIIKKFDINLLELFEISHNYLNKAFQNEEEIAKEIKHSLEVNANEYFAKGLFRPNRGYIGEEVKFKLLSDLETHYKENINNNESFNDILIKSRNDVENLYSKNFCDKINNNHPELKRSKNIVIQNLLKILAKFNGVELYDEYYKKLNESLYKFKKSMLHSSFNPFDESEYEEKENYFLIKISLKMLYDTPFFFFKLTEISNHEINPIKRNSFKVDSSLSNRSLNNKNNNNIKNSPKSSFNSGNKNFNFITSNFNNNKAAYNNINILIKKSFQKKVSIKEEISHVHHSSESIPKIENNFENNPDKKLVVNRVENKEFKYYKLLNFILLTLIMISFTIYIIILFLQNKMIIMAHSIFKSLFYNYYQRDKLLNIYSSIISLLFKYSNFWINDINSIEDYRNNIINSSLFYDNNYHKFYKYYVQHKNMNGEDYSELLEERNFTKIQVNYENKTYTSDYISQSHYVFRYGYNLGAFDNDNNIEYDVNMILFDNYLNNLNTETKSSFSIECFYLMVNYEDVFKYYFHSFQVSLEDYFETFSTKKSNTYLFLEIFGIFIYFIFFLFVIIFLYSENKTIFSNVLNMFIDFTQDGDYSFKNQKDNFIIKKKIEDYITLTKNFNFSNLKKYNTNIKNYNFKPEIKSPILKSSTSKMKSSNILINLNAKKNSSIENIFSLTGSNTDLIKRNSVKKNFKLRNSISNEKKNNNNSTIENLKSTLNGKEQIIEEEISLTASNILIYMKNPGIKKIKYYFSLIAFFLLIIIIYFFLKIENSLSYIHDIKTIFFDFGQLTYRYTLAFYYYNSLRVLLISKKNGREDVFENYSLNLDDIYKNNQKILNTRIQSFKETNELYSILKVPWNNTSIKKKICGNNEKCLKILETYSESKLVTDGLLIALDAIFQKILNTFNDYLQSKNFDYNQNELIKKLIDNEFQLMESTLNFVINVVQDLVYSGFYNDENNIKKGFQSKINLFNTIAIFYCFMVLIVVMFGIINHISTISELIGDGTIRINKAFCYIKENNLGNKIKKTGTNTTIITNN